MDIYHDDKYRSLCGIAHVKTVTTVLAAVTFARNMVWLSLMVCFNAQVTDLVSSVDFFLIVVGFVASGLMLNGLWLDECAMLVPYVILKVIEILLVVYSSYDLLFTVFNIYVMFETSVGGVLSVPVISSRWAEAALCFSLLRSVSPAPPYYCKLSLSLSSPWIFCLRLNGQPGRFSSPEWLGFGFEILAQGSCGYLLSDSTASSTCSRVFAKIVN
ncbi:hypothetical protein QR680_018066 [Steinernema hermaphroditum]|uniref:Uncharacterized protein n=1 Tax=Steinernema hermaphroditum TaxID=289476 RepID=A0AA39LQF2_9BILA|nr:hypothetical protein QR680_018066 [Steinernema hermaphroditum]